MKIVLGGTVGSIATRVDGSVSIKFETDELDAASAGNLFQLRGKYAKALFSDDNITELEANVVAATELTGTKKKSPSQRLRNVLYKLFEQSGYSIEFENFYATEMERIIDGVKSKLNSEAA